MRDPECATAGCGMRDARSAHAKSAGLSPSAFHRISHPPSLIPLPASPIPHPA